MPVLDATALLERVLCSREVRVRRTVHALLFAVLALAIAAATAAGVAQATTT